MRLFPEEILIMCLKGQLPTDRWFDWARGLSKEECVEELKDLTGHDFGGDGAAWEAWFKAKRNSRRAQAESMSSDELARAADAADEAVEEYLRSVSPPASAAFGGRIALRVERPKHFRGT